MGETYAASDGGSTKLPDGWGIASEIPFGHNTCASLVFLRG